MDIPCERRHELRRFKREMGKTAEVISFKHRSEWWKAKIYFRSFIPFGAISRWCIDGRWKSWSERKTCTNFFNIPISYSKLMTRENYQMCFHKLSSSLLTWDEKVSCMLVFNFPNENTPKWFLKTFQGLMWEHEAWRASVRWSIASYT